MKILISRKVFGAINSIYEYIARDSIKYANITSEKLYINIFYLENFPYMGRYVPEFSNKKYRELIYKSYRIVYNVSEETNIIFIHSIIHGKRNFSSLKNSFK